jgi:nitrogen fixation protein NifZ
MPEMPKYQWGQRVQAAADLFNDGTYPDQPPECLLATNGELGEVVQVGRHVETNTIIYVVEFQNRHVVGCLEDEIVPLHETAAQIQQEKSEPV